MSIRLSLRARSLRRRPGAGSAKASLRPVGEPVGRPLRGWLRFRPNPDRTWRQLEPQRASRPEATREGARVALASERRDLCFHNAAPGEIDDADVMILQRLQNAADAAMAGHDAICIRQRGDQPDMPGGGSIERHPQSQRRGFRVVRRPNRPVALRRIDCWRRPQRTMGLPVPAVRPEVDARRHEPAGRPVSFGGEVNRGASILADSTPSRCSTASPT